MQLLTLDPSSKIFGLCLGNPETDDKPKLSSFKLPDLSVTRRYMALESFLIDYMKGNGVTDVLVEENIIPKVTSFPAVVALAGATLMSGVAAVKCGCNCSTIHISTWRADLGLPTQGPKNVLALPEYREKFGNRKSALKDAKRQWVKDAAYALARKHGMDPKDDNEADAFCIWQWKREKLRAKIEERRYDLFADTNL